MRDTATGKITFTTHAHSDSAWSIAWSPDSRRLASASWDHTVQVWNITTGNLVLTYRGHSDLVIAAAWSPDGTRIASAGDEVEVWEAE